MGTRRNNTTDKVFGIKGILGMKDLSSLISLELRNAHVTNRKYVLPQISEGHSSLQQPDHKKMLEESVNSLLLESKPRGYISNRVDYYK